MSRGRYSDGRKGRTDHKAGIGLSEVYAGGVEVCPLTKSRDDDTGAQNGACLYRGRLLARLVFFLPFWGGKADGGGGWSLQLHTQRAALRLTNASDGPGIAMRDWEAL